MIQNTPSLERRRRRVPAWVWPYLMVAAGLWFVWQLTDGPLTSAEQALVGNWTHINPDDGSTKVLLFFSDRQFRTHYQDSAKASIRQDTRTMKWRLDGSTLVLTEPVSGFRGLILRLTGSVPTKRFPIRVSGPNTLEIDAGEGPLVYLRGYLPAQEVQVSSESGTTDAAVDTRQSGDSGE